jgi:hypothetical protein
MDRLRARSIAGALGLLLLLPAVPASADPLPADITSPVVSVTGLNAGQLIGRGQLVHPVFSDDVGVTKVQVLVNGKVTRTYPSGTWGDGVAVAPPVNLDDLDTDVTIRVYDAAKNHGEATTRVHVDTANPHATITPAMMSFVGGVVTFTATDVSDDTASISIRSDSGRVLASTTSAPWTMTWDTAGFNGAAWVEYLVLDRVGNWQWESNFLAVDNGAPEVKVQFPFLPSHTVVEGRVRGKTRLTAQVLDNGPIDRVEWWVDGVLRLTSRSETEPYPFDWDTGQENRTAKVEVRAFDSVGNHTTVQQDVVIDNAGPVITSLTPGNRALIRGEVRSTVKATDASGITSAALSSGGDVSGSYSAVFSTWDQGPCTIEWTLADPLGNETVARRVVINDTVKPALKIAKAPKDGARVKGLVKVTASAGDRNGINRVELLVNGKVVAKDARAGYAFSVNPKKYGKKFTVRLRAYDKAGNATLTPTRIWRR